jgi:N-methylhydantoinase A/oxoprolinase/acetone carboxylase beta subunit
MDQIVRGGGQNKGAFRVACDVGGTFTDLCFLEEQSGKLHVSKTPTTANPIDGVVKGIELGGIKLDEMTLFAHGTTLATNALITRRSRSAAEPATTCGTLTRRWRLLTFPAVTAS